MREERGALTKRLLPILLALALILSACGGAPAASTTPEPVRETESLGQASGPQPTPEPTPAQTPDPTPEPTSEPTPEPPPAPEPARARLLIGGDVVLHLTLYDEALQEDGSYDFSYLFTDVEHYIQEADYAVCCFEGAMCGEGVEYAGYPLFLLPDGAASSLKNVGFDLVALASNHGVDGGKDGLDRTLDVFDSVGMDHVGTFRTQAERDENHGVLVKDINGIRIAFLDYTYGTNGIPIFNFPYAMNVFNSDYMDYCRKTKTEMFEEDMAYAQSLEPDLIAVIVHWGAEFITVRQPAQTALADYLFSLGADLVLGGHPHVPQPMETVEIENADGTVRTGYLCYCLGNLAADMQESAHPNCSLTALVQIDVVKDPVSGETSLEQVRYIPLMMLDKLDYWVFDGSWRHRLLDIHQVLSDVEAGDDHGLDARMIRDLEARLEKLHDIMGPELVYFKE